MSDSNAQKTLIEAAMEVRLNQIQEETVEEVVEETPEVQEEVVEETTGTEELVYEYLSSFFGADLNESIDELTEEQLEEAIVAINTLADAVNEYFELDEASLGKKIKRAAQTAVAIGHKIAGTSPKSGADFTPREKHDDALRSRANKALEMERRSGVDERGMAPAHRRRKTTNQLRRLTRKIKDEKTRQQTRADLDSYRLGKDSAQGGS